MLPSSSSRPARGYILLAVMLLLAILVLLVAVAHQRAGDEDVTATFERSDAQARVLAEAGLERTRAYLGALLEREVDLDRALDPNLDTDCAYLPALGGGTSDDFLPAFTDGEPVVAASSGKVFLRVPADNGAEGAYFVRIDDNDDDAQDDPVLWAASGNNRVGNCLEGALPGVARANPVRDRDGLVWVTVIGVHPGTSLEGNAARHTLRVLVGPGDSAGLIAGGTVLMQGGAHVCGPFGDVVATGSIEGGCLCGAGCSSGAPWNSCGLGNTCVGQSAGSQCSASLGGAGGECAANVTVEAPPRVSPWDVTLAPLGCVGTDCTPFYYLRLDETAAPAQARLYAWNYSACPFPRAGPRICGPQDCATCWALLDATRQALDIHVSDGDPGLRASVPSITLAGSPRIWRADGVPSVSSGPLGCDVGDTGIYPGQSGFGRRDMRDVTFDFMANPAAPQRARMPRGVWFVEGNVRFRNFETPVCAELLADASYGVSLIATGNIVHEAEALSFRPVSPKGFVLLAGRDLVLRGSNSRIHTCGFSAAVMAHEQVEMVGNSLVEAQLVAENASRCSSLVSGDAVRMYGSATVSVPRIPPVPLGPPARVRLFSESTH
ncbi:hypothetical protein [Hyalangium rubrum]|uniref:Uncharacterized protein n=1 Tax=Hyalangium rubrum TaxID=3103134 RepID=A0ABU5H1S4_9BACT|nr:hypothetical protein [Hyalangium sp. s54d21]MDY7227405.1 hypothetical protein [Hyalangium sp. s54d21]